MPVKLPIVLKKILDESPFNTELRTMFNELYRYPSLEAYAEFVADCAKNSQFTIDTRVLILDLLAKHCAECPGIPSEPMKQLNDTIVERIGS